MAARRAVDVDSVRSGDRRALAQAITLVESSREDHREASRSLLHELLPNTGNSLRIGVTGPPGAGKSTFIEALGMRAVADGYRLAVLAVDPTSPVAGGSILGDKTRMEELSRSPNAFIRPSPSLKELGGVAQKTRESILLCEAAGFDLIVIETIGVGQSEYEVASMVDYFLALIPPNAGDELQGIKRGIMELVDALVVNKADDGNEVRAAQTQSQYLSALRLLRPDGEWQSRVHCCSALSGAGVGTVFESIRQYQCNASESGLFERRRAEQNAQWLEQLTKEELQRRLQIRLGKAGLLDELQCAVADGQTSPLEAMATLREWLDSSNL